MIHETTARPKIARRRKARALGFVDAAMEIVERDGLDALTLQRLASRLDVAVGAVYRYFASKDAVIAAMQNAAVAVLAERLTARDAASERVCRAEGLDEGTASLVSLLSSADEYYVMARTEPARFGLLARTIADPRVLVGNSEGAHVFDVARPVLEGVAKRFVRAESAQALDSGNGIERAVLYWAGMHGVMQLGKLDRLARGLFDPERRVHSISLTLLRGWGADGSTLDRATTFTSRTRTRNETP